MKTKVIFRKDKRYNDVIAFFPEIPAEVLRSDVMLCYQRIGQHGSSSEEYYLDMTEPASIHEYQSLYLELTEDIGYDLQICKRISPKMRDMRLKETWKRLDIDYKTGENL